MLQQGYRKLHERFVGGGICEKMRVVLNQAPEEPAKDHTVGICFQFVQSDEVTFFTPAITL